MNTQFMKDHGYARYEQLLLYRDRLKRECRRISASYLRTFGALSIQVFQARIRCLRKKKMVRYIRTSLQLGQEPNLKELTRVLTVEMEAYEKELERMKAEYASSLAYEDGDPEELILGPANSLPVSDSDTGSPSPRELAYHTQILEMEIRRIVTSEPYTYRDLLNDPPRMEKKQAELRKELVSLSVYLAELDAQLAELAGV